MVFIVVCGYVASGKTTVSGVLREVTDSEIIRTDDIRKQIFPKEFDFKSCSEAVEDIESWIKLNDPGIDFQQLLNPLILKGEEYCKIISKYSPRIREQKEKVYDQAFGEIEDALAAGKNVLFDATFSSAGMRSRAYQAAIENGVEKIYIIQVVCDESIVASRLEARILGAPTTSNAKQLEVFRKVKKEFDESRIQDDSPRLSLVRFVYDTGNQTVKQIGESDKITKTIERVLINLSKKYVAITQ